MLGYFLTAVMPEDAWRSDLSMGESFGWDRISSVEHDTFSSYIGHLPLLRDARL